MYELKYVEMERNTVQRKIANIAIMHYYTLYLFIAVLLDGFCYLLALHEDTP